MKYVITIFSANALEPDKLILKPTNKYNSKISIINYIVKTFKIVMISNLLKHFYFKFNVIPEI